MSRKTSEDFDFIKNKFDAAEPEVPQALNESVIEYKILSNAEHNTVKLKKNKMPVKVFLSAAACFVLIFGLLLAVYPRIERDTIKNGAFIPSQETGNTVSTFKNYEEIYRYIDEINKLSNYNDIIYGTEMGGSASAAETYAQVDGIDEADVIKANGNYIFYTDSLMINIYLANNGVTEPVSSISIEDMESNLVEASIRDMYVSGNRLAVNISRYIYENETKMFKDVSDETVTRIYDISNPEEPEFVFEFTQSGYYNSSRLIGNTEYIITNYHSMEKDTEQLIPYTVYNGKKSEIPANHIAYFDDAQSSEYTVISAVNIETGEQIAASKAVFGASHTIYCNENNLYLTGCNAAYSPDDEIVEPETQIIKISIESNQIVFLNSAKVDGYVLNQFSMDEKDGFLRISTTASDESGTHNNLFILDEGLNIVGSVTGFAEGESIYAVRFIGDMAYVITFEQIDPLFVIDLSNPESPEIKGEVEITGFSSLLIPVDENTLLGIGYELDYSDNESADEGVKLVLFDISDSEKPKVLDSKVLVNFYSEAQYNHKAVVINSEKGYYAIPYSEDKDNEYNKRCTGVVTFEVNENEIEITNQFDNQEELGGYNTSRCTFIDDYIYSFDSTSDYNIHSYLYE